MSADTRLSHAPNVQDPREWLAVDDIFPAPENDLLYGPVDPQDPKIQQMAQEMQSEQRSRTLLTVSQDHFVMDGHRRLCAARLAGLTRLECVVNPILHGNPVFVSELVRYNNQRIKSNDVLFREAVVSTNAADAYKALKEARAEKAKVDAPEVEIIEFADKKAINQISEFKTDFFNAVADVLNENSEYHPLTARQIHYMLLNDPPLKHTSKDGRIRRNGTRAQDSTYRNDDESYKALLVLLKDARLCGMIPWEIIHDPTRPVTIWNVHKTSQPYAEQQLRDFLLTYSRDLLQSQPNHIELFAEKKTLATILRPLSSEYCLPMTIGSGCCSIAPIQKLVERFKASGKEKLIILAIADLDPAGLMIARSFCQRLRDYFGIENVDPRRVALTKDQVKEEELEPGGTVWEKEDVNREAFRAEVGDDTYELEALPPDTLKQIVNSAILDVLDLDAFNHEIQQENEESRFLQAKHKVIIDYAMTLHG